MLMRVAASGVLALVLAGCAALRSSGPPPLVRDGALARAAEARPEPVPGRSDGHAPALDGALARPEVSGSRPAAPLRPALPDEGRPAAAGATRPADGTAGEAIRPEWTPDEGTSGEGAPQSGNPAVVALLESAREAEQARQYGRAAAALERALKVDARDPRLWHRLAAVRFREGRHAEAEALALRSLSLRDGADRDLVVRNWRVIAAARRAQGDEEGASEARRRADSP